MLCPRRTLSFARRSTIAALLALLLGWPGTAAIAQSGAYTLDQAIAAARESTGGKVLRAKTRSKNGRETHEIRVLTKDGHVRTLRFPGRRGGNNGR